jgi:hypothetical protein
MYALSKSAYYSSEWCRKDGEGRSVIDIVAVFFAASLPSRPHAFIGIQSVRAQR